MHTSESTVSYHLTPANRNNKIDTPAFPSNRQNKRLVSFVIRAHELLNKRRPRRNGDAHKIVLIESAVQTNKIAPPPIHPLL